jgi:nucleotide-binding universal stress UspA family protein
MKLLIAYDGSKCADAALVDLRQAGLPASVEVLVLSIADVMMPSGGPQPDDPAWVGATIEKARARCAQAVEQARTIALSASKRIQDEYPGWMIRAESAADSPAWAIIEKARTWNADLVWVGAQGHSGTGRLILGSVSQRVVADAPCSVRVARGSTEKKVSGSVRIIVGLDGSRDSEMALQEVAARQWPAGSEVRLVTVIDSAMSTALALSALDPTASYGLNKKTLDTPKFAKRMNQVAAEHLNSRLAVSSLVRAGNPKVILVREAKRWKADCIFVGAKGLRGIERFLIGSVSLAVASRANCSVEVVRSPSTRS